MLFSFFNHESESSSVAVFCLETGSVTLVITKKTAQEKKIEYIAKYSLLSDTVPTGDELLRNTLKTIETAFADLHRHRMFSVLNNARVVFLLGSPWHVAWNDQATIKKETKFKVTKKIIDETISDSFSTTHKELEIIGSRIMSYKMNGYAVADPIHKYTDSLTMHVYVESAPKNLLTSLKNSIEKHLPHSYVDFSTYTYGAVRAIQKISGIKDFILILPEHETTEIVLVRGGVIDCGASLPFGSATLARQIFGKQSSGVIEAMQKTKNLVAGTLNTKELEQATVLLTTIKDDFLRQFRDTLWKMNDSLLFPSTIFVGGKSLASYCMLDWIEKEDYANDTFTVDGFKVAMLGGKDLMMTDSVNKKNKKISFVGAVSTIASDAFEINKSVVK